MATDKLFTVAGTSKLDGEVKVRFANDVMRIKVLAKNGHEDITLIELPEAMTKLAATQFIQDLEEFQSEEQKLAIADYLERNAEKPAKVARPRKAKEVKSEDEAATEAVQEDVELEDAPF